MSTTIIIKDLVKSYPAIAPAPGAPLTTTAVDSVNLTVHAGELFFLLGPSGCGKTTLLRMIAGFIEPTSGNIVFSRSGNEKDITYVPAEKRDTGMVFQSYALWPHMTVAQNVGFGLEVRGVAKSERDGLILAALRQVRMEQFAARKPTQLSGGQQQRVALARALVVKPSVLLLDEPLSNLDAKLRIELRSEIRRICKESGITTVYVTHDQKEALSMADRMAIMRSGKIEQLGTPTELYRAPTTRFSAEFLGEVNVMEGIVSRGTSDVTRVAVGSLTLEGRPSGWKPAEGDRCLVCTRPEAWAIVCENGINTLRGQVIEHVYLGEVANMTVRTHDGQQFVAALLNPRSNNVGEVVFQISPDDVIILPR